MYAATGEPSLIELKYRSDEPAGLHI